MVFPTTPLYLDPPNWQQHPSQQILQGQNSYHDQNQHHLITPPQPQQTHQLGIGPSAHQIRPNSMAEEARRRRIPPPNGPMKCPRCDSINTKFCYYNNYNLLQPRHFCKTCRRYWTHGGALRNVPVGGGCRRNKRPSTKSSTGGGTLSSSKSSISSTSTMCIPSGSGASMPFMTSLQSMVQLGQMSNMGLAFSSESMHTQPCNVNPPGFTPGGLGRRGIEVSDPNNLRFSQVNQTHVQFPNFLGGFQIPRSFQNVRHNNNNNNNNNNEGIIGDGDEVNNHDHQREMNDHMSKSMMPQSSMKTEENGQQQEQGLNIANQMMTMEINTSSTNMNENNQYWGDNNEMNNANVVTSMWTDLSGLNSSSTSHL